MGKFPGEVPLPPGVTGDSYPITSPHQHAMGRMLSSKASLAPFTSPAVVVPSRHPSEVGDRLVSLAGCLLSVGVLPRAQPQPQCHRQGFVSASVQCLRLPRMDPGNGTSSAGTLSELPPPCRCDEPNGLGRRKVPDERVPAPQPAPRGAATVSMQIHGVITPGRREIRHCLVPDKPSQAVTHLGGIRAACCMARPRPACTDV